MPFDKREEVYAENRTSMCLCGIAVSSERHCWLIPAGALSSLAVRINIASVPIYIGPAYVRHWHYIDIIMTTVASQITSLPVVYSIVYSGADQRKHQGSASMALCAGNSPNPVNSPHKEPVTRKMVPFDDVIMGTCRVMSGMISASTSHYHDYQSGIMSAPFKSRTQNKNDDDKMISINQTWQLHKISHVFCPYHHTSSERRNQPRATFDACGEPFMTTDALATQIPEI